MTLYFGLSSVFAILLVVLLSATSLVNGGMVKKEREQEQVDGIGVTEKTMAISSGLDSRKKSISETIIDIVIGFLLFLPVNFFVLPLFVDQIAEQNIIGILFLSSIYTSIAVVRKYVLRRWFESMRK
jgi:hypothetical protein